MTTKTYVSYGSLFIDSFIWLGRAKLAVAVIPKGGDRRCSRTLPIFLFALFGKVPFWNPQAFLLGVP